MCLSGYCLCCVFFFKQKTAYEMRISDWSSDVCSSDLTSASAVDLGMLLLVRAGSPEPVTVNAVFQCGPTRVHTRFAGDYLRISMDGREIGRASCRERVCQYV